jgi:hypothetical protein
MLSTRLPPHAIFPAQGFSVGAARAQAEAVGNARRRLSLVRMCKRALHRRDVHLVMDGWAGAVDVGVGCRDARFVSYLRLVAMFAFGRRCAMREWGVRPQEGAPIHLGHHIG